MLFWRMSYETVSKGKYGALKDLSEDIFFALVDVGNYELSSLNDNELIQYFSGSSDELKYNNKGALVLVLDGGFEILEELELTKDAPFSVLDKYTKEDLTNHILNSKGDHTLVINSDKEVGMLPPRINNNLTLPIGSSVYDFIPNEISFKEGYIPTLCDIYGNVGSRTMIAATVGVVGKGHINVVAKKQSGPYRKTVLDANENGVCAMAYVKKEDSGTLSNYLRKFERNNNQWIASQPTIINHIPKRDVGDIHVKANYGSQELTPSYGIKPTTPQNSGQISEILASSAPTLNLTGSVASQDKPDWEQ